VGECGGGGRVVGVCAYLNHFYHVTIANQYAAASVHLPSPCRAT